MPHMISRRSLLAGAGAGAAILGSGLSARAGNDVTVGIVYVGPRDDYGWNQAHAEAAAVLKTVPGVTVLEEERVPETDACVKTMESMIKLDGASLIFGTSYGYFDPFMIDLAKSNPSVQFRHPSTIWTKGKHPDNLGSYFCYLDQADYVSGIAAGLSTKTNKLGFVAAKPIDIVLRNVNSFTLGARKVNPKAVVQLVVTGDWALPVREAEATNALIDAGCDVITCQVDSPKVMVQTAEARGVKCCGHNVSQATLAPKGYITGAENKWATFYKSFAADIANGTPLPNVLVGGYDRDMVRSSAFGAGATDEAKAAATAAIAALTAGAPIYVGPIKDNKGKLVIDKTYGLYDPFLENTDYLVEGVVGSL